MNENQPATKADIKVLTGDVQKIESQLTKLETNLTKVETKLTKVESKLTKEIVELEARVDTKLDSLEKTMHDIRDQIIRAFDMNMETIRKEMVFADEYKGLENRVQTLEEAVLD